jgi:hypothetical protein
MSLLPEGPLKKCPAGIKVALTALEQWRRSWGAERVLAKIAPWISSENNCMGLAGMRVAEQPPHRPGGVEAARARDGHQYVDGFQPSQRVWSSGFD